MEKWEIDITHVEDWILSLDDRSYALLHECLEILSRTGPSLGRPLVDTIKASRFKNMKELRPGSSGPTEMRVLFAFDPTRKAILLVAGDKRGQWVKWYKRNIPKADDLFELHIKKTLGEY